MSSTFDTQTLAALVGIGIDYTGDMANPSGNGAILRAHATSWGAHVDVALEDGRAINGIDARTLATPDMRRGCLYRFILTGQVHGAEYLAQLSAAVATRTASLKARDDVRRSTFEAAESARQITDAPLFYWNGIKDYRGAKLQKAWYRGGELLRHPPGTITIYARDYGLFSARVNACFTVMNDTDPMTDYFADDTIRVIPTHPLYPAVQAAMKAQDAHRTRRTAKKG